MDLWHVNRIDKITSCVLRHGLSNASNMLEVGMYQGVSAKVAEHRKHTEMIPSVLSWAANVYHWQRRAMGPGDQRH